MAIETELLTIGEKTLPQAADPCLMAYCPSMELLAIGISDNQVLIYRLNGQKVHSVTRKGQSFKVESLVWKPNGHLLAIAYSDGIVRLIDAESNKMVHQISVQSDQFTAVTCLNWTSNETRASTLLRKSPSNAPYWKDFIKSDLPRDLALIDIESSMPKLSALPPGGTSEDIFSSRSSTNALFRAFDPKDNETVDVMVAGTKNGHIHLSIYDSFIVGSFSYSHSISVPGASTMELLLHSSHRAYSTHSLIFRSSSASGALYFVPMDLRFVSVSNNYLSLIASKATTLNNLLRYIHQTQTLMVAEWKSTQELPSRFLENIDEALAEKNCPSIVPSMYHQVATGHTIPTVKDWLVDELSERGHKRWDKAVTTGLENLRRLTHENLMPALERCSVILSRLLGIAKYQGSNTTTEFSSQQISLVMDTISCLNLVSARILTYVVDELDQFLAFSSWLRHEIDRLASSSSTASDDMVEKDAMIDHSKVLLYIQTAMNNSRLGAFFQDISSDDYNDQWESAEKGIPMLEILDEQLKKHNAGLPYVKALPNIDLLRKHLERQSSAVFQQVADSEQRNVLLGDALELESDSQDVILDMIVCPENEQLFSTYVAITSKNGNRINIHQIMSQIDNGISSRRSTSLATFRLEGGSVKDIAFLHERVLLVLWISNKHVPYILAVDYLPISGALSYVPTAERAQSKPETLKDSQTYAFPPDVAFVPHKIEVRRSAVSATNATSARICVLSDSGLQYKIMTLPEDKPEAAVMGEDTPML